MSTLTQDVDDSIMEDLAQSNLIRWRYGRKGRVISVHDHRMKNALVIFNHKVLSQCAYASEITGCALVKVGGGYDWRVGEVKIVYQGELWRQ